MHWMKRVINFNTAFYLEILTALLLSMAPGTNVELNFELN